MIKKVLGIAVVVLLVLGVGFWWFVLRDDPEPELSLDSGDDTSQTTTGTVPESLDGTWTIQEGGDSTAGFRIQESFASGLADHTAVGRSDNVTGTLTIDGTQATDGEFTVDLTALEFTDNPAGFAIANRTNALRRRGLQTDDFPNASFTITQPIEFGEKPEEGVTVPATVTGELTLHGVTNEVTFDVEAELQGNTIRVATTDPVPVALADYDIEKPTGGPVAAIDDEGSFEFLVVFTKD